MHTLSVTFNPTDTTDCNSVSTTVQLTVIEAVLTVGAFNIDPLRFPGWGTYGEAIPPLRYSIKNFVNGDDISVVSGAPVVTTTAVQGSPVGQYPITPTIGTLSAANYTFRFVSGTLTITPTKLWVSPYNVTESYHDPIPNFKYSIIGFRNGESQSVVSGAPSITTTAVRGSSPGEYPITATIGTLSAPNYVFGFNTRTLTIAKARSVITWPTPTAITYGTALSVTQLSAKAYIPGTFVYTPAAGNIPAGGTDTLSVTFTPTDTTDYNTAVASVQLTVSPAIPTINWLTPSSITAGTPLSSAQLDATSPEAGSFVYTPPGGTLLSNGGHTLSVTLTPTNSANYTIGTATAHIFVYPATGATTTSLAITSAGNPATAVASGLVVTLTATVTVGSAPLNAGTVNFCDAMAAHCEDIHLVGSAELTSVGTATVKFRPGVGSHSYEAAFTGTKSNPASTSGLAELTVTGPGPSATAITGSGSAGDYSLTALLGGANSAAPSGMVSFLDSSNGDAVLGTASLISPRAELEFFNTSNPPTGNEPYYTAVADFNGDGIADMAVMNITDQTVSVLLGNGDATFTAADASSPTGGFPSALASGDFNGDGIPDLAVVHQYGCRTCTTTSVTVLLGNGDGTFTVVPENPNVGSASSFIALGDFNGDGILDLAVGNGANGLQGSVMILLGNGDGTFLEGGTVLTGQGSVAIAPGDFNGDGNLDLAVVNEGGNTATILLGNGDGTFAAGTLSFGVGFGDPWQIAVGDFNGDGIPDLAVLGAGPNSKDVAEILLGDGNGTFTYKSRIETGGLNSVGPALGDFNGDGILDLAVANESSDTLTVMLGDGEGKFTAQTPFTPSNQIEGFIAAGDFNGDGVVDLVLPNAVDNSETVLVTERQLAFTAATSVSVSGTGTHQVVASYPGDSSYKASVSAPLSVTAGGTGAPTSANGTKQPRDSK